MHIDVIDNLEVLAQYREDWEAVYAADPEAQFFLSWTWMSKWLERVEHRWFVLAAKPHPAATSYVAFFPFRIRIKTREDGATYHELAMAGNRAADYTGLICTPGFEAHAIPAFGDHVERLRWSALHLESIRASAERIRLLLNSFPQRRFSRAQVERRSKLDNVNLYICPYVQLPRRWDDYVQTLSANTRQKVRRFLRLIERADAYHITHANAETVERDLDILCRFWAVRWAPRKGELANRHQRVMHNRLMDCFASEALFLPVLWKGDRPLGAVASMVDKQKKTLLFSVGARDGRVSTPPPGIVLHAYSIRYAIENGFTAYDFLRGNEPYKYAFGAQEGRIRHIVVRPRDRIVAGARATWQAADKRPPGQPSGRSSAQAHCSRA